MKYAICSEVFKTPIEETIRAAAEIGFDGIEIAPFNVARSVDDVPPARRAELRRIAADCGIEIIGLHWLLVSPEGLHITTRDDSVRKRSWDYLRKLIEFCDDLGGEVMVLGSPKQRNLGPGDDLAGAMERALDGLRGLSGTLDGSGVRFLLEPLHPEQTDFLDNVEDAIALARRAGHPRIGYILDTRAMSGMKDGVAGTLRKHGAGAGHFHANEPGGLGPGMGSFDFRPVIAALRASGYRGWISSEPFDYAPDGETVARTALKTLRAASGEGA